MLYRSILWSIMFNHELKKGSTELLVLSLLDQRARHGYEIGKLIELRSGGKLHFRIGSLYPILCRLEDRSLLTGRWVERAGERRRRYYKLTSEGRKVLARERGVWKEFVLTVNEIVRATS
jgi:PadR family transcriptional regulator, regulatory protein PadR